MRYLIEPMRLDDIPSVQTVETQSFSAPWSAQAYEQDLRNNRLAHYIVLREIADDNAAITAAPPSPHAQAEQRTTRQTLARLWQRLRGNAPPPPLVARAPIVGFAGIWLMVDEAHLVTIAVAPGQRGKGLGELLLVSMIDMSCILGAQTMTLEVRVSNHVAQALYRKYAFKNEGVRRRYYSDNGEDALIMTTETLTSASYQSNYQMLKRALLSRLKVTINMV
jgi:[ribosomal protein S18]-alanine N-acetyltransferase